MKSKCSHVHFRTCRDAYVHETSIYVYIYTFTAKQQLRNSAKNVSHKMSHTIIASYVIIFHGKSIDHSISPRISEDLYMRILKDWCFSCSFNRERLIGTYIVLLKTKGKIKVLYVLVQKEAITYSFFVEALAFLGN